MAAFIVRGFDARGNLLLETTHTTETSASIEIDVWQTRMARSGDRAARAELIDCRPGGRLTNIAVYSYTKIAWSWLKQTGAA